MTYFYFYLVSLIPALAITILLDRKTINKKGMDLSGLAIYFFIAVIWPFALAHTIEESKWYSDLGSRCSKAFSAFWDAFWAFQIIKPRK